MLKPIAILLITMTLITGCNSAPAKLEPPINTPIEARDLQLPDLFSVHSGIVTATSGESETASVEEALEMGLSEAGASPTHLALIGTTKDDSMRCEWRGVARTMQQREDALRFWLGLNETQALPSPADAETQLMADLTEASPAYLTTLRENFRSLARGGLSNSYQFLSCYVDIDATEYLLGTGPSTLTVAYDRMGEGYSYDLYQEAHTAGEFGSQAMRTEQDHQAHRNQRASDAELLLGGLLEETENLFFLAPMASHHTIAVEAWQVIAQWKLETDSNGDVQAIRFGSSPTEIEYSQTLSNLKSRITTAAANDPFADDRITDVADLTQHYRAIGAYEDITPDDGSDVAFMPAMPPPPLSCAGTTAVGTDPDPGLVDDCNALLDLEDTLTGTATLNWSKDMDMASWDGIRLGGSLQRVRMIILTDESLSGTLPALLGNLTELRRIDLDENALTGSLPPQIGSLKKLTHLYLNDNHLTGELPPELGSIAALQVLYVSDNHLTGAVPTEVGNLSALTQLVLADNQLSGPLPDTLGNLQNLGHLRLRDNSFSGQIPRTLSGMDIEYLGLSGNDFEGCLPTDLETDGNDDLFRPELQALPSCGPSFGETEYAFTISATEPAGAIVGTVTATPYESGDTVTYAITAGNGLFTVDASTGAITLAKAPTGTDQGTHTITVEVKDSHGQESRVTSTVTLTG